MFIQQIRNATILLHYGGQKFVIDPVLAQKGSYPPFPNSPRQDRNNPLVDLPLPVEDLYSRLMELDKDGAQTIEPNDRKKLIRAIEIVKVTGEPIRRRKNDSEYEVEWIGLNYPREVLYDRTRDNYS